MGKVGKAFFAGLAAMLPIVITVWILIWLGATAESVLGGVLHYGLGRYYHPGMGLVAGIVVIFLVGLALQAWVFRKLFAFGENLLKRIPVVKTVYGSVRDLMAFFSESKSKSTSQVVMVTLGDTGLRLIGVVTREDFSGYPAGMADAGVVAVYFPMSYQMGGFTAMMPRSAIQPIEMPFQDAMRFALTAGMSAHSNDER
jgi:uncharacterized membrane protein